MVLDDDATLDHQHHAIGVAEQLGLGEGIAANGHEVGELSGLDGAELVGVAQDPGVGGGGADDGLHRAVHRRPQRDLEAAAALVGTEQVGARAQCDPGIPGELDRIDHAVGDLLEAGQHEVG